MPTAASKRRSNHRDGRAAAERGEKFEKALERAHEAYLLNGIANIIKLPVPTVPAGGELIRRGVQRQLGGAIHTYRKLAKKQNHDYMGYFMQRHGGQFTPNGLSINMEAKSNRDAKTSLAITDEGSGISPHQLEALHLADRSGAMATVVWRNGEERLVLPPHGLRAAWAEYQGEGEDTGRKSIRRDLFVSYDLAPYPAIHGDIEDWLYTLRMLKEDLMVRYKIEAGGKKLTIDKRNDLFLESDRPIDRQMADRLARECRTPEEFIERMRKVDDANE